MADVKISQLPEASSVSGSDIAPVVASGTTSKITITNLIASIALIGISALSQLSFSSFNNNGVLYTGAGGVATSTPDVTVNTSTRALVTYNLNVTQGTTGTAAYFSGTMQSGNILATNGTITSLTATTLTGTTISGYATGTISELNFLNATGSRLGLLTLNVGTVNGTTGAFSSALTVGGINVCLANGTNCQSSGGGGSDDWTDGGTFLTPVTSTRGIKIYAAATSTAFYATSTSEASSFQQLLFTHGTSTGLFATALSGTNVNFTGATGTSLSISGLGQFGSLLVGGQSVCVANGTNCPSSYSTLTVTTFTTRNVLDISGAVASSTLVLSGRSAEIGTTPPIPTSTQIEIGGSGGIARTVPAMNASSTNCVTWGPEYIRDAWDGALLKPRIEWTNATGSGDVYWRLQAQSVPDNTYLGVPFTGAPAFATTTAGGAYFMQTDAMTNLTVGGATTGTPMMFKLCRLATNGGDTLGADAYPNSLILEYGLGSYSD